MEEISGVSVFIESAPIIGAVVLVLVCLVVGYKYSKSKKK